MKRGLLVALACLSGCQAPGAGGRATAVAQAAPVCLSGTEIDRTDVADDSTILFTMRNRTVYRNHLPTPCYGLSADPLGFSYAPTDPGSDIVCSNLVTIRANTAGTVCQLGAFVASGPAAPR